jgi:hypothetical protein
VNTNETEGKISTSPKVSFYPLFQSVGEYQVQAERTSIQSSQCLDPEEEGEERVVGSEKKIKDISQWWFVKEYGTESQESSIGDG